MYFHKFPSFPTSFCLQKSPKSARLQRGFGLGHRGHRGHRQRPGRPLHHRGARRTQLRLAQKARGVPGATSCGWSGGDGDSHRPWQIGVGRLVSMKNGWFSGSTSLFTRYVFISWHFFGGFQKWGALNRWIIYFYRIFHEKSFHGEVFCITWWLNPGRVWDYGATFFAMFLPTMKSDKTWWSTILSK